MKHIFQIVCCSTLAALGLLVVIRGGLQLQEGLASRAWPNVTGQVISSQLKHHTGRTMGYTVEVEFSCVVNGTRFRSDRVRATEHIHPKLEADRQLQAYSPGREVAVFFEPSAPSIAFLEPGVGAVELLVPAIGLAIAGGSGFALRMLLVGRSNKLRHSAGAVAVKLT